MSFSRSYLQINEDDESKDGLLTQNTASKKSWWKGYAAIFLGSASGALVATLIGGLVIGYAMPGNSVTADLAASTTSSAVLAVSTPLPPTEGSSAEPDGLGDQILHCGSTPAEARSMGCIYDVMMQDWMPEPCYDSVLTEKYLAEGNWTWWSDQQAQNVMTDEEMRKGEHSVAFMMQSYHKAHCIFTWEKTVRAVRNNAPMIEEMISYDHVLHCRKKTLSDASGLVRGVQAPTAFARCATYNTWKKHLPSNTHSSTD